MILATNISKHYGKIQAVRNISFEVAEGQTLVLLGTSGCGKTTTLKMLNRLIEASDGEISIDGKSIFDQNPEMLRRTIGYVSQNNGLFPHFTARENIEVVPKLLNWSSGETIRRTDNLLEQLQLPPEEFANKYPDELSGGQKQRVAIARALVSNPPVLLLDEPFGALDPVTRATIRHDFQNLPELKSKTIVLVTHDVQEAFELGDRICVMDQGRIVQSGTARELLFQPVNAFVQAFFEHQRLYFELTALTFDDIQTYLPPAAAEPELALSAGESLWAGMQELSKTGREELNVVLRDGSTKSFTNAAIFQALNHLKRAN